MARLTLRLPDSLHSQLSQQAKAEGVSLNQYIVFSLTRAGTAVQLASQQARFHELSSVTSTEDAEAALSEILAMRQPKDSDS